MLIYRIGIAIPTPGIDATGSRVDVTAAENPGSFALVLDRVLKGLPYEPETVGELLTGLGSMARTTVTNEDASYLLSLVGRNLRSEDLKRAALPVTYVRSGESRAALADFAATDGWTTRSPPRPVAPADWLALPSTTTVPDIMFSATPTPA